MTQKHIDRSDHDVLLAPVKESLTNKMNTNRVVVKIAEEYRNDMPPSITCGDGGGE